VLLPGCPRVGFCTEICKSKPEVLHFETDGEVDCLKKCRKSGAVVNPGQCSFAYCPPKAEGEPGRMAAHCEQTGCTESCQLLFQIFGYPSVSACRADAAKFSNGAQG